MQVSRIMRSFVPLRKYYHILLKNESPFLLGFENFYEFFISIFYKKCLCLHPL